MIELTPVADTKLFAFKYVNGHPVNAQRGIHTVMAFGALADVDSGYPLLLAELTLTTALRTAATSVLAAKVLARTNSKTMALIGKAHKANFRRLPFIHNSASRKSACSTSIRTQPTSSFAI